jgi:hypothetical protein
MRTLCLPVLGLAIATTSRQLISNRAEILLLKGRASIWNSLLHAAMNSLNILGVTRLVDITLFALQCNSKAL